MDTRSAGLAGAMLIALLAQTACTANLDSTGDDLSPPVETTEAQWEFEPNAYVSEALDFIEANGLFLADIDWPTVRERALEQTAGTKSPDETYPVLKEVIDLAGGRHSTLREPDPNPPGYSFIHTPEAELLGAGVAVLNIPAFRSPRPEHIEEYAEAGWDEIARLSAESQCGWIVDVRENYGGNMLPMISAVTPLLPEGTLMQFIDRDGNSSAVAARDGGIFQNGEYQTGASSRAADMSHLPVAVLQSGSTASSAEAVVITFMSRDGVRTFGADTAGLSTGNVTKTMPDGAVLRVTRAYMANSSGVPADGALPVHTASDDPLSAATKWLRETCEMGSR
ncbi:S41 family peptidase [Arthrobacter luteolus]|uniref:S41 family peptidase n=1 Tax=Arthrobacter luteolus TaxID=98672 RepID=UPI00384F93AC